MDIWVLSFQWCRFWQCSVTARTLFQKKLHLIIQSPHHDISLSSRFSFLKWEGVTNCPFGFSATVFMEIICWLGRWKEGTAKNDSELGYYLSGKINLEIYLVELCFLFGWTFCGRGCTKWAIWMNFLCDMQWINSVQSPAILVKLIFWKMTKQ